MVDFLLDSAQQNTEYRLATCAGGHNIELLCHCAWKSHETAHCPAGKQL